jgi:hypothetical protein
MRATVGILSYPTGPFDPASIAGLVGWWDCSDTATTTIGAGPTITQWDDKSGNGYHLTTSGTDPVPTTVNGLQAANFAGSKWLGVGSFPLPSASSDFTLFTVVKMNVTTGVNSTFALEGSGAAGNQIRQIVNGNKVQTYFSDSSTALLAGSLVGAVNVGTTSARVHTTRRNGSTVEQRIDNTADGSQTISGSGSPVRIRVGMVTAAAQPLNGILCEICLYDDNLSDLDRDAVITYLLDKWT